MFLFLLVGSLCAFGQKLTFLVGAQTGFPNGNFSYSAGLGIGVASRLDFKFSERFSGIVSIDGISFAEKSVTLTNPVITVKSKSGVETLQLGGKFNFLNSESNKLYISGELGISNLFLKLSSGTNSTNNQETNFCYRYGIGYALKRWDIGYLQQFISNGQCH